MRGLGSGTMLSLIFLFIREPIAVACFATSALGLFKKKQERRQRNQRRSIISYIVENIFHLM